MRVSRFDSGECHETENNDEENGMVTNETITFRTKQDEVITCNAEVMRTPHYASIIEHKAPFERRWVVEHADVILATVIRELK